MTSKVAITEKQKQLLKIRTDMLNHVETQKILLNNELNGFIDLTGRELNLNTKKQWKFDLEELCFNEVTDDKETKAPTTVKAAEVKQPRGRPRKSKKAR